MAQTIQIKRSSSTPTPTSLSAGELAYSDSSDKLFVGQPSNNTVVSIGGKYYTDIIDARTLNSITPNSTTSTASRTYQIQKDSSNNSVVNVPWTGGSLSTTLGIGNDTSGTDIDVSAGDDINFSTTSKAIFGGNSSTANRMEIGYNASGSGVIQETGTGSLTILGQSLALTADDSDDGINIQLIGGTTNLVTKIISDGADVVKVSPSGFELGALGTTVDIIRDEDNMVSDDADALATQQSIKKYVDDNTATAAVADSGTSLATGDQIHTFVTGQGYVTSSGVTGVSATAPVTSTGGTTPTIAVTTGTVTNGGTSLATGDQIYDHVTGRISGFASTSGATFSGDVLFGDNKKAIFGAGSDLKIYHDTNNSVIEDAGTGNLKLICQDLEVVDQSANKLFSSNSSAETIFFAAGSDDALKIKNAAVEVIGRNLKVNDITEYTANHGVEIEGVTLKDGNVTATGELEGTSLDINGNADISGNLTLTGDLNITGNVNSTSVTDLDVTDKTITVGVGQTAATSSNSGITVAGADAKIVYEYDTGSSTGKFEMDQGTGSQAAILTAANWGSEYTGAVDGGTF